jgi:ABC-type bacteriocin/lantibiotic exporter with double-glycine peptidase domain
MGLFILIAIAKWTGNNDSSALITIGAFMAAAYKMIPGVVKLINASGQMRAYEFSMTDLVQPWIKEKKEKERSAHPIGSIDLKKISFQYPKLPVLKDFNLSVKKGDFVGISGESGKGKTTVFNLMLGFLAPSSGGIFFNDASVDKDEIKKYWPSIAYVRQQSFFIHDTILRNITLEEDGHSHENLQLALQISGVDELIEKFPGGLDHFITENGKNISGGQQQRIALARAVYKNVDLVLLDEPFNELDEGSETRLLEHFRVLCGNGKLVIMITHDKKSLAYCNKIISLDEQ